MIGKTVSHYKITRELGSGGMGVVYEAVDTKLDRTVALKFLPPESTRDPDAKARFVHEAKAASAIDHPNVCNIFEIDETEDGHLFLAMACYEGETLKDRIGRGPLPLDDALDITRQVAEGLTKAHERDIVHRDIKPANIFITNDGVVKILDFGLAKLVGLTQLTQEGTTLGTAHYMSPEQAGGQEVDHRSDLWCLGVCLYEMITGRVPFQGDHPQAVTYAILNNEPEPVTGLRTGVPLELERIIGKCLAKNSAERYQHADDLLADLTSLSRHSFIGRLGDDIEVVSHRSPWRWILPAAAVVVLVAVVGGGYLYRAIQGTINRSSIPFEFAIPVDQGIKVLVSDSPPFAISPDGERLVFVAFRDDETLLFYYEPGGSKAIPLPGTKGALAPFFSPDGEWIAFFADNELRRISVTDGNVITICHQSLIANQRGTWAEGDRIFFQGSHRSGSVFLEVSAEGGEPIDPSYRTDLGSIMLSNCLPGAREILVVISQGMSFDNYWLAVLELETGKIQPLHEVTTGRWQPEHVYPHYVEPGFIVFLEEGAVKAVPFDAKNLELRGDPVPLTGRLTRNRPSYLAASLNGTIIYSPESDNTDTKNAWSPVWVTRDGRIDTLVVNLPGRPMYPILSPDGKHISFTLVGGEHRRCWDLELGRNILSPLTFGQNDHVGLWSPDSRSIMFSSDREGPSNLFLKPIRADVEPARKTWSDNHQCPSSWTPDGSSVVFTDFSQDTGGNIWVLDIDSSSEPQPLVVTPSSESHGMVSPDGKLLSYTSNRSGRSEVYLDYYPPTENPVRVSSNGGHSAIWSPTGELLYAGGTRKGIDSDVSVQTLMAVEVESTEDIRVGATRPFFTGNIYFGWGARPEWDVSPDGTRHLVLLGKPREMSARDLRVVISWNERLK